MIRNSSSQLWTTAEWKSAKLISIYSIHVICQNQKVVHTFLKKLNNVQTLLYILVQENLANFVFSKQYIKQSKSRDCVNKIN